jgi:hypothetical protein
VQRLRTHERRHDDARADAADVRHPDGHRDPAAGLGRRRVALERRGVPVEPSRGASLSLSAHLH